MNDTGREEAAEGRRRDAGPALVVGVGASAGGLEALQRLFAAAPPGGGVAYLVMQHLDPGRPSLLADLLGRRAALPVREAEDGAVVGPDQVWIAPPNTTLTVHSGALRLSSPADPHHHPIDMLFRSLAEDQGDRAAAIVLSGTGDDGTLGMRAVREHGGLTLAQTPATAIHPGMPQSAILAGAVDEVLRAEDMPPRLGAHLSAQGGGTRPAPPDEADDLAGALPAICDLLRRRTGNDFSGYKRGTLLRRLRRRLQVQRLSSVSEYIRLLEAEGSAEPGLLLQDLLIAVTRFFRDKGAFDALAERVIPGIVQAASEVHPVRVWVPGCATGEEAYSIAILLAEEIERSGCRRAVQVFATDIDAAALQTARAGRYGEAIAEDVPPRRLHRFFHHQHGAYQVSKELREMCVFSVHNLLRDPPFSQLDLVSCRNVLIYLDEGSQARVMPFFHYALRRGGFLFLGPSEDAAGRADLFTTVDKAHHVFQRRETVGRPSYDFPLHARPAHAWSPEAAGELRGRGAKHALSLVFERMILEEYAPACALVDDRGEIFSIAGSFSRYFAPRAGLFTGNILDHAEGTLRQALRTALAEASHQAQPVTVSRVLVPVEGGVLHLELTVRPAPGGSQAAGLRAVILRELGPAPSLSGDLQELRAREPLIEQLESELSATRADLSAAVRELESANQELKRSNEDLQSANEELHSANEQLQTSKEELQSVNEELETVNAELRAMVKELGVANSDLQNLLASTSVATIFLDRDLAVTRFTPDATALFNLIDTDVGRPLADLVPRFTGTDLLEDVRGVLARLDPLEKEVQTDSASFMLRVLPYRAVDDAVAGAVVTFTDVTRMKQAEAAVRQSEHVLKDAERRDRELLESMPQLVWTCTPDGSRDFLSRQWSEYTGAPAESHLGFGWLECVHPDDRVRAMEEWTQAVAEGKVVDINVRLRGAGGAYRWFRSRGVPLRGEGGRIVKWIGTSTDIDELVAAEAASKEASRRKSEFLAVLSHELRNPLAPIRTSLQILARAEPRSEPATRAQDVLHRQVEQLARLVDDLLDMTRISENKIRLQRQRIDLAALLRRTTEDHEPLFDRAGLRLDVVIPEARVPVHADPTRVAQAVGNLLQNAVKFSLPGGRTRVVLEVEPPRGGEPGPGYAVILVQDDGAGMTAETLSRLFQPFVQADATLDRTKGGLGVGLWLVRSLVELHGGRVAARSGGLGQGTEMEMRLPLDEEAAAAVAASLPAQAARVRRVLVIDDNVDGAEALRDFLEMDGHEVHLAHDGPSGLAAARELHPDMVVCDIGLPGMTGYDVARAFREDPSLRETFLVALTGYAQPEDIEKAKAAGFDKHLSKPPDVERLEALLRQM